MNPVRLPSGGIWMTVLLKWHIPPPEMESSYWLGPNNHGTPGKIPHCFGHNTALFLQWEHYNICPCNLVFVFLFFPFIVRSHALVICVRHVIDVECRLPLFSIRCDPVSSVGWQRPHNNAPQSIFPSSRCRTRHHPPKCDLCSDAPSEQTRRLTFAKLTTNIFRHPHEINIVFLPFFPSH